MNRQSNIPSTISLSGPDAAVRTTKRIVSPFSRFVLEERINRKLGLIAILGIAVQFIVFKTLYPYPDFISDSFNYIDTANLKMPVNLWPVGYAKFLWLIHSISHSDTFLVGVQYLLLEAALGYFFFTVLYLFRPGRSIRIALFIILFFNPLFLYLSNCVLSDALFAALSIVFFVQFLWMFHKPSLTQAIIQGLIIGLAFTILYTAIFYPLISLGGFLLSRQKRNVKTVGSLLGIALIIPFVIFTRLKTKEITGTAEFSVFGGWQLANNALYMYDHITVDTAKLPKETWELNRLTKQFFASVPDSFRNFSSFTGGYFLKVPYAPLKQYLFQHASYEDPLGQVKAWGKVSPLYNAYGKALIVQHPFAFARYYLLLNTKNYLMPPLEKFENYNLMTISVPVTVQDWFDLITPDVAAISYTFQGKLFYAYPLLFLVLNVYFTGCFMWLLSSGRIRKLDPVVRKGYLLAGAFILLNFCFSVFAAPVVLRYQVVPFILLLTFTLLLLELTGKNRSSFEEIPNQIFL